MASRRALEEERQRAEKHLRRSKNLEKAAEERQRHLDKKRNRIDREAEATIDESMKGLAERAEPHLRALQNVPKALLDDYRALADLLRGSVKDTSLAKKRRDRIAELRKGDEVFVPRFEQACKIRKFVREKELIVVMVGALQVEIGYDEIAL